VVSVRMRGAAIENAIAGRSERIEAAAAPA
jgi:hypothetical protein